MPVSLWRLDESSGTLAADSAGSNPGTLLNDPQWEVGRVGGALQLDGVDDSVQVEGSLSLDLTAAITVEAWIRPDLPDRLGYIAPKNLPDTPYPGGIAYALLLGGSGGGKLATILDDIDAYNSDYAPTPGEWTHVAMTWDGTAVRLFAGGVEVFAAFHASTLTPNEGALRLGARNGAADMSSAHFAGALDEIQIWSTARTPSALCADALGTWTGTACE
jgi:hypothetical protein